MNIPDKVLEAARKALLSEAKEQLGARGDLSSEGARFMKIALEAAAPFIAAEAWDRGFTDGRANPIRENWGPADYGDAVNPYRYQA